MVFKNENIILKNIAGSTLSIELKPTTKRIERLLESMEQMFSPY
jgi:hypothetical protein